MKFIQIKFTLLLLLVTIALAGLPLHADPSIAGEWKHSQKTAWLEFSFINGVGEARVKEHQANPDAKGLLVLKDIGAGSTPNQWRGKMYSADDNGFIDATLVLEKDGSLVITIPTKNHVEELKLIRSTLD